MTGSGDLDFDLKEGVMKTVSMKYELTLGDANVTVKLPISLSCRLLTPEELTQYEAREKEAHDKAMAELAKIQQERNKAKKENPFEPAAPAGKEMRRWRDVTGTFEIEATLESYRDGTVTLKKSTGQTISVPIKKLSAADQEYVLKHSGTEAAKPGARP